MHKRDNDHSRKNSYLGWVARGRPADVPASLQRCRALRAQGNCRPLRCGILALMGRHLLSLGRSILWLLIPPAAPAHRSLLGIWGGKNIQLCEWEAPRFSWPCSQSWEVIDIQRNQRGKKRVQKMRAVKKNSWFWLGVRIEIRFQLRTGFNWSILLELYTLLIIYGDNFISMQGRMLPRVWWYGYRLS